MRKTAFINPTRTLKTDLKEILWETVSEALLITDKNFNIQMVNQSTSEFTGYHPDELVNKSLLELDRDQENNHFYEHIGDVVQQQGQWQGQLWQRQKDGMAYCCEMRVSVYLNEADERYLIALNKKQTFETVFLDPLTELPTRAGFRFSLAKTHALAHRYQKRFAVVLIAVGDMMAINQRCGPLIGDQFLYKLGQSLKTTVRESDTVARYSHDVFSVSLDEITQPSDAGMVGQMILFKLTEPFLLRNYQVQSTISIGITVYPEDGQPIDTLIKLAYSAMERARRMGGNQCCFYNPQLADL